MGAEALSSLQSAVQMVVMKKAMNNDAQTVGQLLQTMEQSNAKVMEASVTPHLGNVIDVLV